MARKGIPFLNFDDLIIAIQALSAPSATNVAVDPTGMEIITANNSQGALKQLDTAVDSVNASLTQLGSCITGDWIADSSSALNVELTDDITLPKGKYILICNSAIPSAQLGCSYNTKTGTATYQSNTFSCVSGMRTNFSVPVEVTSATAQIVLVTQSSSAITYTSKTTGHIMAVRIG